MYSHEWMNAYNRVRILFSRRYEKNFITNKVEMVPHNKSGSHSNESN